MPNDPELLTTSLIKLQTKYNRHFNLLGSLEAFVNFIHVILNWIVTFVDVACVSQKSAVKFRQVAFEVKSRKLLRRMLRSVTICAKRSDISQQSIDRRGRFSFLNLRNAHLLKYKIKHNNCCAFRSKGKYFFLTRSFVFALSYLDPVFKAQYTTPIIISTWFIIIILQWFIWNTFTEKEIRASFIRKLLKHCKVFAHVFCRQC